ncbi:MAG: hypothetical protein KDD61_11480 [Bdellovibrionales bacterium]|nr:hypothetical protein [Bdellovibrionales bacterium]
MVRIFLIFLLNILPAKVIASSCCGQGPSSFLVLSGSQRYVVSTSLTYSDSLGRVADTDKVLTYWEKKSRSVQNLSISIGGTLRDRHQWFALTSLQKGTYRDSIESGTSVHLGDTILGYTYEALPEYRFSYWKPIVYLSPIVNLPTGHSIYDEAKLSEGADVTGHNQWGAGIGLTLKKVYFPWTLSLQFKSLYLFPKQFRNIEVSGFTDNSVAFMTSFASRFYELTVNLGLTMTHLSPRSLEGFDIRSDASKSYTAMFGAQKSLTDRWTIGASFSDQSLIGPAENTLLNRSISFFTSLNYF